MGNAIGKKAKTSSTITDIKMSKMDTFRNGNISDLFRHIQINTETEQDPAGPLQVQKPSVSPVSCL